MLPDNIASRQLTAVKGILQPYVSSAPELDFGLTLTDSSKIKGSTITRLCMDAGKPILTNVAAAQPPGGRHDCRVA